MFGSSKKKQKEASELEREERAAGIQPADPTPPKPPLKLREGGGSVLKPAEETPPPEAPAADKKKPKLRLMTGQEERERAFLAAREHYLSKSLPEIKKEVAQKERSKSLDTFLEKLFALIGLFLIFCFAFWLYNNAGVLDNWWKNFIDGIKLI